MHDLQWDIANREHIRDLHSHSTKGRSQHEGSEGQSRQWVSGSWVMSQQIWMGRVGHGSVP